MAPTKAPSHTTHSITSLMSRHERRPSAVMSTMPIQAANDIRPRSAALIMAPVVSVTLGGTRVQNSSVSCRTSGGAYQPLSMPLA